MKGKYEFTVIYRENDSEKKEGMDFVEKTLSQHGINIIKKDEMGIRTLAYEIKKQNRGYYCFYLLEAEKSAMKDLSASLYLSHLPLRFLFVEKEEVSARAQERLEKKEKKFKEYLQSKNKAATQAVAQAEEE